MQTFINELYENVFNKRLDCILMTDRSNPDWRYFLRITPSIRNEILNCVPDICMDKGLPINVEVLTDTIVRLAMKEYVRKKKEEEKKDPQGMEKTQKIIRHTWEGNIYLSIDNCYVTDDVAGEFSPAFSSKTLAEGSIKGWLDVSYLRSDSDIVKLLHKNPQIRETLTKGIICTPAIFIDNGNTPFGTLDRSASLSIIDAIINGCHRGEVFEYQYTLTYKRSCDTSFLERMKKEEGEIFSKHSA